MSDMLPCADGRHAFVAGQAHCYFCGVSAAELRRRDEVDRQVRAFERLARVLERLEERLERLLPPVCGEQPAPDVDAGRCFLPAGHAGQHMSYSGLPPHNQTFTWTQPAGCDHRWETAQGQSGPTRVQSCARCGTFRVV